MIVHVLTNANVSLLQCMVFHVHIKTNVSPAINNFHVHIKTNVSPVIQDFPRSYKHKTRVLLTTHSRKHTDSNLHTQTNQLVCLCCKCLCMSTCFCICMLGEENERVDTQADKQAESCKETSTRVPLCICVFEGPRSIVHLH